VSTPLRLGLLVRSAPWCGCRGRAQLDVVLTAATLGAELDLFFVGSGVLHLLGDREPNAAGLPDVQRAWRALDELTTVRAWAEAGRVRDEMIDPGLLPGLALVPAGEMPALQLACQRLLVL
jgi:sulfur relay (sulfurtransferase) DsrF/TusC family protein